MILAYAEGVNGHPSRIAARAVLDRLSADSVVLPIQTLGELFNVLVRRASRSPSDARDAILGWMNSYAAVETSQAVLLAAADLALNHFSIWDAVIVCAAAEAGCQMLLSEDMQDGFVWKGVTIVNPFAKTKHPLLRALMP
ncbi:MAG TPA: PIN domain-containing protein [Terracidiphilus sp.]|nr:PIN domain-containing protein [Terracidiphilus sp.]